jgi:hypothetical protein
VHSNLGAGIKRCAWSGARCAAFYVSGASFTAEESVPLTGGQAVQGDLPSADRHCPTLADVRLGQAEQRLIAGEGATVLNDLARAHIHRLDGVARVDHHVNLRSTA